MPIKPVSKRLVKALKNMEYAVKGMLALRHTRIAYDYVTRKAWLFERLHEADEHLYSCRVVQNYRVYVGTHVRGS